MSTFVEKFAATFHFLTANSLPVLDHKSASRIPDKTLYFCRSGMVSLHLENRSVMVMCTLLSERHQISQILSMLAFKSWSEVRRISKLSMDRIMVPNNLLFSMLLWKRRRFIYIFLFVLASMNKQL